MFCNKCGTVVADNATVCPVCGAPLQGAAPNQAPYTAPTGAAPVYGQPYAQQPMMVSQKSKVTAGLLAIFLGALGIHNFYLGHTTNALIQLLVSVLSGGTLAIFMWIWAIVEAVKIFSGSMTDSNGLPLAD